MPTTETLLPRASSVGAAAGVPARSLATRSAVVARLCTSHQPPTARQPSQ